MRYFTIFTLFLFIQAAPAQTSLPGQYNKPYVILISCDGFRYDYVERFRPPHLLQFIEEGVRAASMISSFPSKTFPNHYTIATGMYPEHHGLVDNTFYDPERQDLYKISKRDAVEDGSWYKGTPLWVNAEQNGMVSASYFFVGSEADIQGVRPSYFFPYEGSTPNEKRVQQVLDWLALPEPRRPHMITLYFSDMDDAGHRYGPSDDEHIGAALLALDQVLGKLFKGVKATGLPVNIIIVSDHGMADVTPDKLINIDPLEQEEQYRIANNGALAHVYLEQGADREAAYRFLQARETHFRVYKIENFPFYRSCKENPRLGDFILLPEYGSYLSNSRRIAQARQGNFQQGGEHGFNPEFLEMHAIFYANGPAFKKGVSIPSFRNIHIYPIVCRILGLPIPEGIDGRVEVLEGILAE
ncbi:MAG: alkaline phosphatase family protein [Lewinellaceae bacterium]|nr:alkaline phosphatase family protein [Phaeodactylibacter sp.]MCB9347465.1 alkaline phosphatase family protein [Lewinellaceae bacterium]